MKSVSGKEFAKVLERNGWPTDSEQPSYFMKNKEALYVSHSGSWEPGAEDCCLLLDLL